MFLSERAAPTVVRIGGRRPNVSTSFIAPSTREVKADTPFLITELSIAIFQKFSIEADKILIRPLILSTIASFSLKAEPSA